MGSSHIVDIDSDEDTFLSGDGEASGRDGTSEGLALLMFYNVAPNRHGEAGVRFLSIAENYTPEFAAVGLADLPGSTCPAVGRLLGQCGHRAATFTMHATCRANAGRCANFSLTKKR